MLARIYPHNTTSLKLLDRHCEAIANMDKNTFVLFVIYITLYVGSSNRSFYEVLDRCLTCGWKKCNGKK